MKWTPVVAGIVLGAVLAGMWQQLRLQEARLSFASYQYEQAKVLTDAQDAAIRANNEKAELVAAADARRVKELQDVREETERRIAAVRADAVRVRFQPGKRAVCSSENTATAGVADGAGVELTADAGRDVLLLRESLEADRVQIEGLQQYIRDALRGEHR